MCGFFAIFSNNTISPKNKESFKKSSLLLKHRGPDFQKYIFRKKFYLFHSRLSIVDLKDRANQPYVGEQDKFFLIYNGEIYNYLDLKKILLQSKKFNTRSDTEVLFNAFLEWGPNCISRLKGMFAFAIWDNKNNKLYFARDVFGQKQLYFFKNKNLICLSSEIKPILMYFKINSLNKKTISNYIIKNDYGELDQTFFENVYQLSPGTFGIWEKGNLKTFKYSTLDNEKKELNKNQIVGKKLIIKNIKEHLMGDVNVGLALSSGIDSMALLSLIQKTKSSKKLIKNFSIDFGKDFSEFKKVKRNVKLFKTDVEQIRYCEEDVINKFQNLLFVNEAPLGGLMHMALYKLFETAKDFKIKVILSGMGSDEIFLGYESMRNLVSNYSSNNRINLIDNTSLDNREIIKSTFFDEISEEDTKNNLYDFLHTTKLPKNLQMMDRISMINSIELRCPFVDQEIYKFFSKFKISEMISKNHTKILLRQMMTSLDKRISWYEKKKSIQSPQNIWMKKPILKEFFGDILLSSSQINNLYFNKKKIISYWDDFLKGKKKTALPIWQYTNIYFLEKFFNEH